MAENRTLTQRILARATELISIKENWIKGAMFNAAHDKYCALGAIVLATKEITGSTTSCSNAFWYTDPVVAPVIKRLGCGKSDGIESRTHNLHRFNDNRDTQHKDVKNLFCKALKKELEDGPDASDNNPA